MGLSAQIPDVYLLVKVINFIGETRPIIKSNGPCSNQIWWSAVGNILVANNSAQGVQQNQTMTNVVQKTLPAGTYCNQVLATATVTTTDCQLLPGVSVTDAQQNLLQQESLRF